MKKKNITHYSPIHAIASIDDVIQEKRNYLHRLDQTKYAKNIATEHSLFNRIEIAISGFKQMNFIENWYEIDLYLQTLISSEKADICDIRIPFKERPNFGKKIIISLDNILGIDD